MDIHGDELLRLLGPYGGDRVQEVNELFGMISLSVEEIETVLDFFAIDKSAVDPEVVSYRRLNLHVYCIFMSGMFQDELFQIEKSPFVGNLLTHLYDGSPCVGCKTLCTIWTLVVCNDVFNLEGLL